MHRSWGTAYVICIVLILFGLLPVLWGGRDPKTEQRHKDLLARGQPVAASVTHMYQTGDHQAISYQYTIAGETHQWSADPGKTKWMQLQVGSPITVTYLPDNPSVSEYDPARYFRNQKETGLWTIGIVSAGSLGFLIVLVLDIARRRPTVGREPDILDEVASAAEDEHRPIAMLLAGAFFFVTGIACQVGYIISLSRNVPIPVTIRSNGRLVDQHFASAKEKVGIFLFIAIFWCVGLYLMWRWKRAG